MIYYFFLLILILRLSVTTVCVVVGLFLFCPVGQIKKTHYREIGQRQHTQPMPHTRAHMHVHSWSDCGGSVVFIVLKVNFIKTRNKETEPINEIH